MWMTILKNAKGHFSELEKLLEEVDNKYLPGGFYFPRVDVPDALYEELWQTIKSEMRKFSWEESIVERGGFDIIEDGKHKNFQYRLKMKPLITPTPKQAASWKGILIKPDTIDENWKTHEAKHTAMKMKAELKEYKKLFTEKYFTGRSGDKYRIQPAREKFYNQKKEEYEKWIKDNMIPESERKEKFSTKGRIGDKPMSDFDMSSVSSHVDKEAWDKAHKGHFKLQVYTEKVRIINIELQLKLGIEPPPRNPWSFPKKQDMNQKEYREFKKAQLAWRKYWVEYEKYQKSDEYKTQDKIQEALTRVFDLAKEYEKSEVGLDSLFE